MFGHSGIKSSSLDVNKHAAQDPPVQQEDTSAPQSASVDESSSQPDNSKSDLHSSEINRLLQEIPANADPLELSRLLYQKYHDKNNSTVPQPINYSKKSPSESTNVNTPKTPANWRAPKAQYSSASLDYVDPRLYEGRRAPADGGYARSNPPLIRGGQGEVNSGSSTVVRNVHKMTSHGDTCVNTQDPELSTNQREGHMAKSTTAEPVLKTKEQPWQTFVPSSEANYSSGKNLLNKNLSHDRTAKSQESAQSDSEEFLDAQSQPASPISMKHDILVSPSLSSSIPPPSYSAHEHKDIPRPKKKTATGAQSSVVTKPVQHRDKAIEFATDEKWKSPRLSSVYSRSRKSYRTADESMLNDQGDFQAQDSKTTVTSRAFYTDFDGSDTDSAVLAPSTGASTQPSEVSSSQQLSSQLTSQLTSHQLSSLSSDTVMSYKTTTIHSNTQTKPNAMVTNKNTVYHTQAYSESRLGNAMQAKTNVPKFSSVPNTAPLFNTFPGRTREYELRREDDSFQPRTAGFVDSSTQYPSQNDIRQVATQEVSTQVPTSREMPGSQATNYRTSAYSTNHEKISGLEASDSISTQPIYVPKEKQAYQKQYDQTSHLPPAASRVNAGAMSQQGINREFSVASTTSGVESFYYSPPTHNTPAQSLSRSDDNNKMSSSVDETPIVDPTQGMDRPRTGLESVPMTRSEQPTATRQMLQTNTGSAFRPHVRSDSVKRQVSDSYLQTVNFGQGLALRLPRELCLPQICCSGLSTSSSLHLQNVSVRWLQVQLQIVSVSHDGVDIDLNRMTPFVLKERVIIEPETMEEIKVIFAPRQAGSYVGQVEVMASPVVSERPLMPSKLPTTIMLKAQSEKPDILVEVDNCTMKESQMLDFGYVPWGSHKALTFSMFNRSHCTVPVRLVINGVQRGGNYFAFQQNPDTDVSVISQRNRPFLPGMAPSVLCHTLPGCTPDGPAHPVRVTVFFCAPLKQMFDESARENLQYWTAWREKAAKEPPDVLTSRLDIEMDTPSTQQLLNSLTMSSTVGFARIIAPVDMETVELCTNMGQSTFARIPLRNAGNIPVEVSLEITHHTDEFSVVPNNTVIEVGTEAVASVKFTPKSLNRNRVESSLLMYIEPDGPSYVIQLYGVTRPEMSDNSSLSSRSSTQIMIYANKQYLNWGGVPIGRGSQQVFTLRNIGSERQKLRIEVRATHQDFQLLSKCGKQDRLSRSREVIMNPMDDLSVNILFTPTQVDARKAKITIKVLDGPESPKYTIPLYGYGGICKLKLTDAKEGQQGKFWTTVGPARLGTWAKARISICNIGTRAAFVKVVAYKDLINRQRLSQNSVTIQPEEFCLKNGETQVIIVMQLVNEREARLCQNQANIIGAVSFFHGDEVSRKKLRLHVQDKGIDCLRLSYDHPAKNIKFHMPFDREDLVEEELNSINTPKDVELFFSTMSELNVAIIGEPSAENMNMAVPKSGARQLSEETQHMRSVESIPHLYPQHPPAEWSKEEKREPHAARHLATPEGRSHSKDQEWEVIPQDLTLQAPLSGGDPQMKMLQLLNYSSKKISYEVSWPAHCVSISPEQGSVNASSSQTIYISANPLITSRDIDLPWKGVLHINVAKDFKMVQLQVVATVNAPPAYQAPVLSMPSAIDSSTSLPIDQFTTNNPLSVQVSGQYVNVTPSPSGSVIAQELVFPSAPPAKLQKVNLTLKNKEPNTLKWWFSSLTPPYCKTTASQESSVHRLDHTVFRLSKARGEMKAGEEVTLEVAFYASEPGRYSQFWVLETKPTTPGSSPEQSSKVEFLAECISSAPEKKSRSLGNSISRSHGNTMSWLDSKSESSTAGRAVDSGTGSLRTGASAADDQIKLKPDELIFNVTAPKESTSVKLQINNLKNHSQKVTILQPEAPFHVRHTSLALKTRHYVRFPVDFRPKKEGSYTTKLMLELESGSVLTVPLRGRCQYQKSC